MEQVRLEGERVTVRTASADDAEAVLEGVRSSLAELETWMPWASSAYSIDDAAMWASGALGDRPPTVMVAPDGAVVGTCGLNAVDELNRNANLGYWLRTDRTGQGLATEATRLVAQHGLTTAGFQRLRIPISTRNEASRRVAERAGATFEGTMRSALRLSDGFHDAHLFSFVVGDI